MPQVTVMLPVYNGADHLEGALASLSAQTFADMQILISDNASTDATPDIIETWKKRDPRIVSHRQNENIGAVANFDWVLQQANSPWVMFASHDDWWSPNYVEELYKVVTAQAGIQLAAPSVTRIRPDGSQNPRPFHDAINEAKGLHKKILCLRHMDEWFYGLFARQALVSAYNDTKHHYKHGWGFAGLVPLPFALAGTVAGSSAAIYYKRETPLSAARYKPKTVAEQWDLYSSFLKERWRILQEVPLSFFERLVLAFLILPRNVWKLRRLIRSAICSLLHIKK